MLSTITQNKKGLPMKISSISDNDQHVPDKVRSKHERVIKQWRANPPTTTERQCLIITLLGMMQSHIQFTTWISKGKGGASVGQDVGAVKCSKDHKVH